MKVKPFRAPRSLVASVAQARAILRGAWSVFRRHYGAAPMFFTGALAASALIWGHDRVILNAIHQFNGANEAAARRIAWYLGTWGDYPTYNLPFSLLLWLYGVATRNRAVRRLGVVAFLGASVAGLMADGLRLTLGRARPDSHMPDGFYGISHAMRGGFQSFPSGHAAADVGMAVALLMVSRPLGIVTSLFALAVMWARLELERHFPSDVVVGAALGIFAGGLVGTGARGVRFRVQAAKDR